MIQKGNIDGVNLVELTENTYVTYHDLGSQLSIMYDLIENTLSEYKIKSNTQTSIEKGQ